MRFICAFLLFTSVQAYADSCMKESQLFIELVGVKWGVSSSIEKAPAKYKDEKWQYIHSVGQDIFKKGKIDDEKAIAISKLIASNDFSNNPEVEVNIFEDYWLLSCRQMKDGITSAPLSDISKDELLKCWNSVSSRKEFQQCITPLMSKK